MNIKQAKQEIENTLRAYLTRDDLGNYLIPAVRQRPVLRLSRMLERFGVSFFD